MQLEVYLALKEKVIRVRKSALVHLKFNMKLFPCKKKHLRVKLPKSEGQVW